MPEQQNEVYPALLYLKSKKDALCGAVPQTYRAALTWERIAQAVGVALAKSDKLRECTPVSIYSSVLEIVGKGLDIGMDGQAYLVPFKGICTAMIGARGKIELAYRSGQITKIVVQALYENDDFSLDLANGTVEHAMTKDYLVRLAQADADIENPRGMCLGAYARVWLKTSSEPLLELMTIAEFAKIVRAARARSGGKLSQAYQEWPDEMLRRSVLNRALKRAPMSRDMMEMLNKDMELDGDSEEQRPAVLTRVDAPDVVEASRSLPALADEGTYQVEAELARLKKLEAEVVQARAAEAKRHEETKNARDMEKALEIEQQKASLAATAASIDKRRADVIESTDVDSEHPFGGDPPTADPDPTEAVRSEILALQKSLGDQKVGAVRKSSGMLPGPLKSGIPLDKLTAYRDALLKIGQ